MAQIIIFKNPEGNNVHVCYPTGEISIEEVLAKDCPEGAMIVDDSVLPNEYNEFFDAWELDGDTIVINFDKAKEDKLNRFNIQALQEAQKRQLNELAGITNTLDNQAWVDSLNETRNQINSATTLDELKAILI